MVRQTQRIFQQLTIETILLQLATLQRLELVQTSSCSGHSAEYLQKAINALLELANLEDFSNKEELVAIVRIDDELEELLRRSEEVTLSPWVD